MGGGATSVEFRLRTAQNGEYDVYDLNNGGGWGVPVGVKPVGKNCDSIVCTPTLATCPDPKLALKDSYGQTLGCASACYGGIGNSDQQCCNGPFADAAKCTPDLIQFYSYFKEPCRHAYAYYQDSRQGSPTVNFLCKAEDDPGFTVIFCPEGDGDSGPKGGAATSTGKKTKSSGGGGPAATGTSNESGKIGEPTGTAAAVTQPPDIPAISAVPSLNVTSTNAAEATLPPQGSVTSESASATDEAAAMSTAPATPTDDATASAAAADASASKSAVPEETPGGFSKTAMIGVGVGIALVAVLGVVVACVVSRRKNSQPTAATTTKSAAAQSSDPEAGHASAPSAGAGMWNNLFEPSGMKADRTVAIQARATTHSGALAAADEDDNASFLLPLNRITRPLTISRGSCTLTTPTPRAGLAGA